MGKPSLRFSTPSLALKLPLQESGAAWDADDHSASHSPWEGPGAVLGTRQVEVKKPGPGWGPLCSGRSSVPLLCFVSVK